MRFFDWFAEMMIWTGNCDDGLILLFGGKDSPEMMDEVDCLRIIDVDDISITYGDLLEFTLFRRFWLDSEDLEWRFSLFVSFQAIRGATNDAWVSSVGWCGEGVVRRNRRKDGATGIEFVLKSSDVYSWERDEGNTIRLDVIPVVECIWKNHVGESGHV